MSGIACPVCGSTRSSVTDSRPTNKAIRRRRKCAGGHRFTTYESVGDEGVHDIISLYGLDAYDRRLLRDFATRLRHE